MAFGTAHIRLVIAGTIVATAVFLALAIYAVAATPDAARRSDPATTVNAVYASSSIPVAGRTLFRDGWDDLFPMAECGALGFDSGTAAQTEKGS